MPSDRRYGRRHQNLRRLLAGKVAAGKAVCCRCGEPIKPGEAWDLGHDDDRPLLHRGPEHAKCNRGAPAHEAWGRAGGCERRPRIEGSPLAGKLTAGADTGSAVSTSAARPAGNVEGHAMTQVFADGGISNPMGATEALEAPERAEPQTAGGASLTLPSSCGTLRGEPERAAR
jgi:hypothetical protein